MTEEECGSSSFDETQGHFKQKKIDAIMLINHPSDGQSMQK